MENEHTPIPFRMTLLIVGFFMRTNTDADQDELDDWIAASMDNQRAFEACIEITQRPQVPNELDIEAEALRKEKEETENYLPRIAELLTKFIEKTITETESQELKEWVELSGENQELFSIFQLTDNADNLLRWLLKRLWEKHDLAEWN